MRTLLHRCGRIGEKTSKLWRFGRSACAEKRLAFVQRGGGSGRLSKVLTRLHDSCKIIVIGHEGQNDLFDHPERSGFVPYLNWFAGDDRTAVCRLVENHRGWISQHADELTFRAAMNLVEDQ